MLSSITSSATATVSISSSLSSDSLMERCFETISSTSFCKGDNGTSAVIGIVVVFDGPSNGLGGMSVVVVMGSDAAILSTKTSFTTSFEACTTLRVGIYGTTIDMSSMSSVSFFFS